MSSVRIPESRKIWSCYWLLLPIICLQGKFTGTSGPSQIEKMWVVFWEKMKLYTFQSRVLVSLWNRVHSRRSLRWLSKNHNQAPERLKKGRHEAGNHKYHLLRHVLRDTQIQFRKWCWGHIHSTHPGEYLEIWLTGAALGTSAFFF